MNRDPARFDRLFADHAVVVQRFVARRVEPSAVEDVVSETFLVAWRGLEDVPELGARSWLFTTANWVIANHRRSRRRRQQLALRLAAEPIDAVEPELDTDAAEAAHVLVRSALAMLAPQDQEVLRLTEWDDLPAAECAQILRCSRATFAVRLHRARQRFRRALESVDHAQSASVEPDSASLQLPVVSIPEGNHS